MASIVAMDVVASSNVAYVKMFNIVAFVSRIVWKL